MWGTSRFGKSTHINMISNSVTHLRSCTNSAIADIAVNSAPISPGTPRRYRRELCAIADVAARSSDVSAPRSPHRASLQSMIRVANISLFVYIGSPGLHRNSRQAPGSSRHSVLECRRLAYIYNIYKLSVHNLIFSIERTPLFFDIFRYRMSDQSPRGVGPHPINF